MFVLHEWLVLSKEHIGYRFYGVAFINALIMGKIFLVAETLHFGEQFRGKPLVIPIVYKSVAFSILLVVAYIVEESVVGLFHSESLTGRNPENGRRHDQRLVLRRRDHDIRLDAVLRLSGAQSRDRRVRATRTVVWPWTEIVSKRTAATARRNRKPALARPKRNESYAEMRERLRDPLLTVLTLLLGFLLFVVAPMHAAGIIRSEDVGLGVALVVIATVWFQNGMSIAVGVMFVALGLALIAAVLRLQDHSSLDLYLDATAWILIGLSLSWVVAKIVFGPGVVNYHRVIGAILLYLTIGMTFVALYTFLGLAVPNAFSGMTIADTPTFGDTMVYFSFGTLTTVGAGDIAAVHPIARSLTIIEAMIGQLYPATLLARLVTLEIEGEKR